MAALAALAALPGLAALVALNAVDAVALLAGLAFPSAAFATAAAVCSGTSVAGLLLSCSHLQGCQHDECVIEPLKICNFQVKMCRLFVTNV